MLLKSEHYPPLSVANQKVRSNRNNAAIMQKQMDSVANQKVRSNRNHDIHNKLDVWV